MADDFLLLEDGDELLLEDGDNLLLESSTPVAPGGPSGYFGPFFTKTYFDSDYFPGPEAETVSIIGSGGLVVGGTATVSFEGATVSVTGSGGVVLGGTAVVAFVEGAVVPVPEPPQVTVGGGRFVRPERRREWWEDYERAPQMWFHVASGGLVVGGPGTARVRHRHIPSGGVALGGKADVVRILNFLTDEWLLGLPVDDEEVALEAMLLGSR